MTGLPLPKSIAIVERELRIAARGRALYRWRMLVVGGALGLMALFGLGLTRDGTAQQVQGQALFFTLVVVAVLFAFFAGVTATADSVSREKREGTLGLLFLTDLRGADIIFGKLAASSLNLVYGLLGLLPLLAIPIMLGGVSIGAGVIATLSVMNLMFLSLCLGILVSTLSWDERRATFAATVTGLVVLLGPLLVGGLGVFFGRPSWGSMLMSSLSPLHSLLTTLPGWSVVARVSMGAKAAAAPSFADLVLAALQASKVLVPSHLLGWVFLILAGRLATRAWHSRSGAPVKRTMDERVFTPRDPVSRGRHRRAMLEVHPLVWLLERHPGKRFYADGLVVAILVIWFLGYRSYGSDMFGGPSWFLITPLAVLVHLIFASWVVAESSMRLLEDRRSGALELLLCTSLTDRELIHGHRLSMQRVFLRPVLLLAAAEVFVGFTGFGTDDADVTNHGRWLMIAMAMAVVLDTHALSWISLRLAISLPTVNRVSGLALAITPFGPLGLTFLVSPLLASVFGAEGGITFPWFLGTWAGCVVFVDLVVGQWICRRSVLAEFREAAARIQPKAAVAG